LAIGLPEQQSILATEGKGAQDCPGNLANSELPVMQILSFSKKCIPSNMVGMFYFG
jgi:hypothetical protein